MEKFNYYICGLKLSIRKEILEELRRLAPHVRSNLIKFGHIAAAIRSSQRTLMANTPPQQLVNIKPSKKALPTFVLGDPRDAPCN